MVIKYNMYCDIISTILKSRGWVNKHDKYIKTKAFFFFGLKKKGIISWKKFILYKCEVFLVGLHLKKYFFFGIYLRK
jgi:hypothetical protein